MADAPVAVQNQFRDDQKTKIVELYKIGKTQEEIANEFGVSRRTIMKLCIYLGLHKDHSQAQKSKFDPVFVEQVIKMRNEGQTIESIAQTLNRSVSAVHRVICKKQDQIKENELKLDEPLLCKKYDSMSLTDLAAEYNISVYFLKEILMHNNKLIRPPILSGGSKIKIEHIDLPEFIDTDDWWKQAYIKYGMSSIAKFLNRSVGYVAHNLRKRNIEFYSISERTMVLDRPTILAAYKELGSMSQVAKRFNCTITAIQRILKANNITPTSTSEMFTGEGNPFFGKEHPEEVRKSCAEIGSICGKKFWDDHPEYVNVVREKQKALWSDLEKRRQDSEFVAKLRQEGKLAPKRGIIQTRWGGMSFDSSWEMSLIEQCDKDSRVVLLERDFALVEYEYNGLRNFVPDFRIWLQNGEFIIVEVKNNWLAKQEKERAKISAAFSLYMDKFMVVDEQGIQSVFDRVNLLLSPQEFSFDDVTLADVKSVDYMRFYSVFHYLGQTGRQGPTLGAYLCGKLVAVATISSVSRNEIAERLKRTPSEVRELVRFCIHPDFHKKNFASWFLTRVVSQYVKNNPGIKVLISFADTSQGHSGVLYKAAGWKEDGETGTSYHYVDREGFIVHKKTAYDRGRSQGISEARYVELAGLAKVFESPKKRFVLEVE